MLTNNFQEQRIAKDRTPAETRYAWTGKAVIVVNDELTMLMKAIESFAGNASVMGRTSLCESA